MNEVCFEKCLPKPGSSLSSGEQSCFTSCMEVRDELRNPHLHTQRGSWIYDVQRPRTDGAGEWMRISLSLVRTDHIAPKHRSTLLPGPL